MVGAGKGGRPMWDEISHHYKLRELSGIIGASTGLLGALIGLVAISS